MRAYAVRLDRSFSPTSVEDWVLLDDVVVSVSNLKTDAVVRSADFDQRIRSCQKMLRHLRTKTRAALTCARKQDRVVRRMVDSARAPRMKQRPPPPKPGTFGSRIASRAPTAPPLGSLLQRCAALRAKTNTFTARASRSLLQEIDGLLGLWDALLAAHQIYGEQVLADTEAVSKRVSRVRKATRAWEADVAALAPPKGDMYATHLAARFPTAGQDVPVVYAEAAPVWARAMANGGCPRLVAVNVNRYRLFVYPSPAAAVADARWFARAARSDVGAFFPGTPLVTAARDGVFLLVPFLALSGYHDTGTLTVPERVRQLRVVLQYCEADPPPHEILRVEQFSVALRSRRLQLFPQSPFFAPPTPGERASLERNHYLPPCGVRCYRYLLGVLAYHAVFKQLPLTGAGHGARARHDARAGAAAPVLAALMEETDARRMTWAALASHAFVLADATRLAELRRANRLISTTSRWRRLEDTRRRTQELYRHVDFAEFPAFRLGTIGQPVGDEEVLSGVMYTFAAMTPFTDRSLFKPVNFVLAGEEGIGEGVTRSVIFRALARLRAHTLWTTGEGGHLLLPTAKPAWGCYCTACGGIPCQYDTEGHWHTVGVLFAKCIATMNRSVCFPASRVLARYVFDRAESLAPNEARDFAPELCRTIRMMEDVPRFEDYERTWGELPVSSRAGYAASTIVTTRARDEFLHAKMRADVVAVGDRDRRLHAFYSGFTEYPFVRTHITTLPPADLWALIHGPVNPPTATEMWLCCTWTARARDGAAAVFRGVLEQLAPGERLLLLEWCTSDKSLRLYPRTRIAVRLLGTKEHHPKARTCFDILMLPNYTNVDVDEGIADLLQKFREIFTNRAFWRYENA
jgi:hypothetical protein